MARSDTARVARGTHEAVFELDNVAVRDPLENRDFRLEVLEQFRRELASNDRFDRDCGAIILFQRQGDPVRVSKRVRDGRVDKGN